MVYLSEVIRLDITIRLTFVELVPIPLAARCKTKKDDNG